MTKLCIRQTAHIWPWIVSVTLTLDLSTQFLLIAHRPMMVYICVKLNWIPATNKGDVDRTSYFIKFDIELWFKFGHGPILMVYINALRIMAMHMPTKFQVINSRFRIKMTRLCSGQTRRQTRNGWSHVYVPSLIGV